MIKLNGAKNMAVGSRMLNATARPRHPP
jgi:hypothetical protein